MLILWRQSEDGPSAGFRAEGDGGGWWSGAFLSGARAALAATLTAAHLSAQVAGGFQDTQSDLPTAAALTVIEDEAGWFAPTWSQPSALRLLPWAGESESVSLAFPLDDEAGWIAPVRPVAVITTPLSPVPDELPTAPATIVSDEAGRAAMFPDRAVAPRHRPAFASTDELAIAPPAQDEEGWWPQAGRTEPPPALFTDEEALPITGPGIEDDDGWLVALLWRPRAIVVSRAVLAMVSTVGAESDVPPAVQPPVFGAYDLVDRTVPSYELRDRTIPAYELTDRTEP